MSLNAHFVDRLRKKITQERERRTAGLAEGSAQTFEDYKRSCGYLNALAHVSEWCDAIEQDLNEGK